MWRKTNCFPETDPLVSDVPPGFLLPSRRMHTCKGKDTPAEPTSFLRSGVPSFLIAACCKNLIVHLSVTVSSGGHQMSNWRNCERAWGHQPFCRWNNGVVFPVWLYKKQTRETPPSKIGGGVSEARVSKAKFSGQPFQSLPFSFSAKVDRSTYDILCQVECLKLASNVHLFLALVFSPRFLY